MAGALDPKPRDWALALPLAAFFALFFIAPLGLLVAISFETERQMTGTLGLGQYAAFLSDGLNLAVLRDTLLVGAKATLLCLLFGYPLAWLCTKVSARWQAVLIFLVVLPIVTSVVVRTFAWIVILGRHGIVNETILALGLSAQPLKLLFSETGVVIVLAQVQMPLMVLPLITTLQRIDPNLESASQALGAGAWRTFFKVTLPLSLPGIIAGTILTYTACVTAFVTQSLIGGSRLLFMPMMIFQQAMDLQNWPFAAAVSVIFMVSVLLIVAMLVALSRSRAARLYG
ncbi:putative spermidine/putrescine transport system permease protein [Xanthobacter sp. SG618]|uniref:ABC transporter permease n=1 Tax=Xanthobacter sp. SG618 TaxID=2587121 RepID=UPI00145EFB16|nr:ABC transporter permease [Xanthobacter sp. SG618]NMN57210.1 putative spermidine/putrescine transport system permease protein [Xanthobacter sp. SG618]